MSSHSAYSFINIYCYFYSINALHTLLLYKKVSVLNLSLLQLLAYFNNRFRLHVYFILLIALYCFTLCIQTISIIDHFQPMRVQTATIHSASIPKMSIITVCALVGWKWSIINMVYIIRMVTSTVLQATSLLNNEYNKLIWLVTDA